ncbi:MAG: hypothetical protein ACFBSG_13860 [Leptolyngbyaceae cyanobacterium]
MCWLPCPTNDKQNDAVQNPDEAIALIREVFSKSEASLTAGAIKQQKRLFKNHMSLPDLEALLAQLVTRGVVVMTAETLPRYALSTQRL